MSKFRVYIGFDQREKLAYDVCRYSILHNTHEDIEIIPLVHKELRRQGWFKRPWMVNAYDGNWVDLIDGKGFSTEFSHTRFLVPALNGYKGMALFMDCDMVWDTNIKELIALADNKYAVQCVKHNHRPPEGKKMDGCEQARYPRKNWSSFMIFNCNHPANRFLTPEYVSTQPGGEMHAFSWLEDYQIGALPVEYNWIEGVSPAVEKPKVVHYTEGGPWWRAYNEVAYSDMWWRYHERLLASGQYEATEETVSVTYA